MCFMGPEKNRLLKIVRQNAGPQEFFAGARNVMRQQKPLVRIRRRQAKQSRVKMVVVLVACEKKERLVGRKSRQRAFEIVKEQGGNRQFYGKAAV